jgi:hypothetical protein
MLTLTDSSEKFNAKSGLKINIEISTVFFIPKVG